MDKKVTDKKVTDLFIYNRFATFLVTFLASKLTSN